MSALTDKKIALGVGLADSANLGSIFTLFLKEAFTQFLMEFGRYFMYPFAALAAILLAIISWRDAARAGDSKSLVLRALIDTGMAIGITVAVVGGFLAGAAFTALIPIIFAASIALKTLYNFGAAIYFKAMASFEPKGSKERDDYARAAKLHLIGGVAGLFAGIAVVGVMILAKPIMGILGVIAGLIGIGVSIKLAVDLYKEEKAKQEVSPERQPLLTSDNEERPEPDLENNNRVKHQLTRALINSEGGKYEAVVRDDKPKTENKPASDFGKHKVVTLGQDLYREKTRRHSVGDIADVKKLDAKRLAFQGVR